MSTATVEPDALTSGALPPSMVERMTLILDAFSSSAARLTLEEVARTTHLPRSTAHRILDQLVKLDWLNHTTFGYSLGHRSLHLGGGDNGHSDLRAAAAPHLHDLMVKTGLVVHLAALDGGQVHYLDKMGGRFAASVPSRVGGHAPVHSTALGKASLAWVPAEEVDRLVGSELDQLTRHTIGDLATFHQELHRIRARGGLAFERGECFPDISCVAAAIRGPEGPLGAISLVGDARTPLERVAPLVVATARQVSLELFPGLQTQRRGTRQHHNAGEDQRWSTETMRRLVSSVQPGDWM